MEKIILNKNYGNVLALGAESSSVFCYTNGNYCLVSKDYGNTMLLDNFEKYKADVLSTIKKPEVIAVDMHPGYNTTLLGEELSKKHNIKLIKVQHHKAHIASVMMEHNIKSCIGIAADGLGYGDDGKLWGGEIFDVRQKQFKRIGSLEEQPMLGGDSATLNPNKMLFGILAKFLSEKEILKMKLFDAAEAQLYLNQLKQNFNVHLTTSTGRIFDAAAAFLKIKGNAVMLEKAATEPYELQPIISKKERYIIETTPLFEFLYENRKRDKGRLAATVQYYLCKGFLQISKKFDKKIVFSGGVANNKFIRSKMEKVLFNKAAYGDANICLGQLYLSD